MTEGRFYLGTDNDGHWFVIPADKRDEWSEWLDIDSDDERAWDAPDFARDLGGNPSCVTFENPRFNDD
jgi:hypothetical protein